MLQGKRLPLPSGCFALREGRPDFRFCSGPDFWSGFLFLIINKI